MLVYSAAPSLNTRRQVWAVSSNGNGYLHPVLPIAVPPDFNDLESKKGLHLRAHNVRPSVPLALSPNTFKTL